MKVFALLLLAVSLASCGGTTRPLEGSRITLATDEITRQDFFLMSVREHTLMVSPYSVEYFHVDAAIASSFSVPFEKVRFIEQVPPQYVGPISGAAAAGLLAGAYVGNVARTPTDEERASGTYSFRFGPSTYIGMATGAVFGAAMGYLFSTKKVRTYHLDRLEDRGTLRHVAIYHDLEPPELAKIR
jgi:hypothetical protein